MTSNFSQNAILFGTLQSYCLVCECYLAGKRDTIRHISKDDHKTNLEASIFVEEFTTDQIRKVKKGFFCELCNKYFSTIIQGRLHVSDGEHVRNKGVQLFQRMENGMVSYKNIPITKEAWNGIIENKCIICDTEFDSLESHITSQEHLFQLVQVDVEFGAYNGLYRVLENAFQCLTCNEVYTPVNTNVEASATTHFLESKHKRIYDKLAKAANEQLQVNDKRTNKGKSRGLNAKNALSRQLSSDSSLANEDDNDDGIKMLSIEKFINDFYAIKGTSLGGKDVVINTKIIVGLSSFYCITKLDTWKCEICDLTLNSDDIDAHRLSQKHEAAMSDTPVILIQAAGNEFIREVRPEVYHCGFCNIVEQGMDIILKHLNTADHKQSRISAAWRLHEHMLVKKLE
ncbi:uncharacterized protein LOC114252662 [Bombyx mandarina]|uniref:Uncharacterized protein LOC114252662 n=1 Tax=Bombyx mandarina TaxID=7092 RepID=A0A6J2KLN1_BOMMA|nr:uncharacterized protein LOC114252662 [Bombyx mandarina]